MKERKIEDQKLIEKNKDECGIPTMTTEKSLCSKCKSYTEDHGFPAELDKRTNKSKWITSGVNLNGKNCLDQLKVHIGGKLHSAGK